MSPIFALFLIMLASMASAGEQTDHGFEQMQQFMQQESDRIKAIKILNLDLERSTLELKKKEIEVKLAELNKTDTPSHPMTGLNDRPSVIRLGGVFFYGRAKRAVLEIDGHRVEASEGQSITDQIKLKSITRSLVVLEYADGRQETLKTGS